MGRRFVKCDPGRCGADFGFMRLRRYERAPDAVVATGGALRDGFRPALFYSCLMAEQTAQPGRFALFFYNYPLGWAPGITLRTVLCSGVCGRGLARRCSNVVAAVAWRGLRAVAVGGSGLEHPDSISIAPWGEFLDECACA